MCGHPMLLSQLDIHDIPYQHGHGHILTLVEKNSFQQQVAIYSLLAINKDDKVRDSIGAGSVAMEMLFGC